MKEIADATRLAPNELARYLSAAFDRRIEPETVAEIARVGRLLDADGKVDLRAYVAFLLRETR